MSAGQIRNELKAAHNYDDPQVIAWPNRSEFYVVGESRSDLPNINGFTAVDDPSLF